VAVDAQGDIQMKGRREKPDLTYRSPKPPPAQRRPNNQRSDGLKGKTRAQNPAETEELHCNKQDLPDEGQRSAPVWQARESESSVANVRLTLQNKILLGGDAGRLAILLRLVSGHLNLRNIPISEDEPEHQNPCCA
jgi:hypothetical protein